MKLVEDWKRSWRWFSVRAMGLSIVLQGAWESMSSDLRAEFPFVPKLAMAVLILGVIGRVVKQEPKPKS